MNHEGPLRKMPAELGDAIQYWLRLGDERVHLNGLLGQPVKLTYLDRITCIACGRKTRKSYSQGHCFVCMKSLPQTDGCMIRPETCHIAQGTCRDEAWGQEHCQQPHTIYLANSSGLKVGITRGQDPVGRWIDQGAYQGLAIRRVADRLASGLGEVELKQQVNDKTNWRAMLKGEPEPVDLVAARDRLVADRSLPGQPLDEATVLTLNYPVQRYPEKVRSHKFEKEPELSGTLYGIKGQYLMIGDSVLNVRSSAGYHVRLQA